MLYSRSSQAAGDDFFEVEFTNRRIPLGEITAVSNGAPVGGDLAQVRVIHVWSDFCGPCLKELPTWAEIYERLATYPGFRFLFVAETYSRERAQTYLQRHRATVPQSGHYYIPLGSGKGTAFRQELEVSVQPITLLLDRQSVVLG